MANARRVRSSEVRGDHRTSGHTETRALLGKQAAIIGAEIRAGTFDYARWFPSGNRVGAIQLQVTSAESPKRGHDRPILSQLDRTKTPTAGTSFPRP